MFCNDSRRAGVVIIQDSTRDVTPDVNRLKKKKKNRERKRETPRLNGFVISTVRLVIPFRRDGATKRKVKRRNGKVEQQRGRRVIFIPNNCHLLKNNRVTRGRSRACPHRLYVHLYRSRLEGRFTWPMRARAQAIVACTWLASA